MKRALCSFLVLTCLAMIPLLAGCGGGNNRANGKPQFAFVINVPGRFWDIAHAGCEQAAEEEGVDVEFRVPGESTAAQQKQIVEALMSKGIDGLAISPLNPDSFGRLLDQAGTQFPVICQDSDAPDSSRICYIGTDNIEAGRQMGEAIKQALPKGGEIAIFVGQLDVANAREREQGVKEALDGSNLTIVGTFTDGGQRPRAKANVVDVLSKYPQLKGIIGLWGYNGPQALNALKDDPGRDVKVVGADEDIETLQAVREGKMFASIVQDPYEFGYQSIKMLAKLHRGEDVEIPKSKLIYVPTKVLTQENVDEIEDLINKRLAVLNQAK